MRDHYDLTRLDENSSEYQKVETLFMKTMKNVKINYVCFYLFSLVYISDFLIFLKKIDQVHNEHLLKMYEFSKKTVSERNPTETKNEYLLFHGSDNESIESICKFGFNRSYCGKNSMNIVFSIILIYE